MQPDVRGLPQVIADYVRSSPYWLHEAICFSWHVPTKTPGWATNAWPTKPPDQLRGEDGQGIVFVLGPNGRERYA
jgi:hypothetical protein